MDLEKQMNKQLATSFSFFLWGFIFSIANFKIGEVEFNLADIGTFIILIGAILFVKKYNAMDKISKILSACLIVNLIIHFLNSYTDIKLFYGYTGITLLLIVAFIGLRIAEIFKLKTIVLWISTLSLLFWTIVSFLFTSEITFSFIVLYLVSNIIFAVSIAKTKNELLRK